MNSRLPATG